MPVPDFVRDDLAALDLTLNDAQLEQLARLLELTLEANQRFNLTAIRDRDEAWRRLIIDSLTILPGLDQLPDNASVIDVGTGGGFPGLPGAIARPNLKWTLLDSTGKKVEHVRSTAQSLALDHVEAVQARAEDLARQPGRREAYDAAVCRAVGPMNRLLEYCLPFVAVDGRLLAMKGPKAEDELAEAGVALDKLGAGDLIVVDAYPEQFDNDLVIVSVIKERPTPKAYPRPAGTAKRDPL